MPKNIVIKEAKNMQKEDIHRFLDHILTRQKKFGVENAFRFKIYLKKRKEYLAEYPTAAGRRKTKHGKDRCTSKSKNQLNDADDGDAGAANGTANGAAVVNGTATTTIPGLSTLLPSIETNHSNNRDSLPVISNHGKGMITTTAEIMAAANITAAEKSTKSKPTRSKKGKGKLTATATANITAAEENSVDGNQPRNTRSSKRNLQRKVPKSDAIAIQEAKKFIQKNSKRRR